MTFLYHPMWIKWVHVFRNIFHVHLNIMICTSRILRQQKRIFEQIHSTLYETKALTSPFNKNSAELFNHMYDLWPQTTTSTHGYTCPRTIIQNNKNRFNDFWKLRIVAPQAAATELLIAGMAQWVCFVCSRWQEVFLLWLSRTTNEF